MNIPSQCGSGGHLTCDVCDRENEACPECEERGKRVRVAVVEKVNMLLNTICGNHSTT